MQPAYQTSTPDPTRPRTRSGCPIHLALEVLGDRWSLLIIRDMAFDNRRTFGELLENNPERIASNILARRLERLQAARIIRRHDHPVDRRKNILRLTPAGIALVTLLKDLGEWGMTYVRCDPAMSARVAQLTWGGPAFLRAYQHDLVATHSHRPKWASYLRLAPQTGGPVAQALTAAHEAAAAVLRDWRAAV